MKIFGSALCLLFALPLAAQTVLPAYIPNPVTVPNDASYVTRDGAVQIIGNDGWDAMVAQFDDLFLKTHPTFKRGFHLVLKGIIRGDSGS